MAPCMSDLFNNKKQKMRSIHRPFNVFLSVGELINRKIVFVSEFTPDRRKYFNWIPSALIVEILYQGFKALDMAWAAISQSKTDAIVIFEHRARHSFLLYIACLYRRVPVFFFVHGLQQVQGRSITDRAGFKTLQLLERHSLFYPIHLEINDEILPPHVRFKKSIVIPHPLPPAAKTTGRTVVRPKIRVGGVGMIRHDKPVLPLLDLLIPFAASREDVELVLGVPARQLTDKLKTKSVVCVDTSSPLQYFELLSSIDIVVTAFDRNAFYFRPSGVINDAITSGCYVVAPDYPILSAQLSKPTQVGMTYAHEAEILKIVDKAITHVRSKLIDFTSWRQHRENEKSISYLAACIEKAIART